MFKRSQIISPKSLPGATTAAVPALASCFHRGLEQDHGISNTELPKTLNTHFWLSLSWGRTQFPSQKAEWDIVTPVSPA